MASHPPARHILEIGALISAALAACSPRVDTSPSPAAPALSAGAAATVSPATDDRVQLPAGTFRRGRDTAARPDESPPHTVRLNAFSIDRTLVTRADFTRFVAATGHVTSAERAGFGLASSEGMDDWAWERVPRGSFRRPYLEETPDTASFLRDDAPVVMVSWFDAVAYCASRGARLPTEAEWEYAMRAGSTDSRYPWGEEPTRAGKLAVNFWQGDSHRENAREDGFVYVSPVRAFEPNAWGLYDPVGNVWQWTADWYAPDTYARAAAEGEVANPRGPESGKARVLRGGSWWCGRSTCQGYGLHYRGKAHPDAAFNNNGFRCARD